MNKYQLGFLDCISDLLLQNEVLAMNGVTQHVASINCFCHCLFVAYVSYRICLLLGLKYRDAARGGLMHDMFLYDQHKKTNYAYKAFHFANHPIAACANAEKVCDLSDTQKDIILTHMWPLTPSAMPRSREAAVVNLSDKLCTLMELTHLYYLFGMNKLAKKPALMRAA